MAQPATTGSQASGSPRRPSALYWTPGYWGASGAGFGWNAGYWGASVGFYGGVNYGGGYIGTGFVGGSWAGSNYRYNTAVYQRQQDEHPQHLRQ